MRHGTAELSKQLRTDTALSSNSKLEQVFQLSILHSNYACILSF